MNIEVKGHSGCNVDIVENDSKLYIYKSTDDPKYFKRLKLQGHKQEFAEHNISIPHINFPHIYNYTCEPNDGASRIIMDYVYSKNFIDFFESATVADINDFCKSICEYIEWEILNSNTNEVSNEKFVDKINSIISNCNKNSIINANAEVFKLLDIAKRIFADMGNMNIPIGVSHGDLTLSNILFSNNGTYYIIDFLDSFIETPLQDIVKLRQDSKYFWSTLMYEKKYDTIRVKIVFDYIDRYINNYFKKYDWYVSYYNIMQLMNILRILPYVKEEKVAKYLINIITDLLLYGKYKVK